MGSDLNCMESEKSVNTVCWRKKRRTEVRRTHKIEHASRSSTFLGRKWISPMHMQVPWNMQAHTIPGHGSVTKHGVVDQADITLEG